MKRLQERDRGSGTIWAGAVVMVICAIGSMILLVAIAQMARHRANAAADLAALAAAQVLLDGTADPCVEAAQKASVNDAELASCEVDGEKVTVVVSVAVRLGRWGLGHAKAAARAGPVD
ncbi:MAG: Rv3654c family TadE-like protein [Antricoccus sp.]